MSVCPLEAYGFFVGPDEFVCAALPVGKTKHWHEYDDRFARMEDALPALHQLLKSRGFALHALYHSRANLGSVKLHENVPDGLGLIHLPVYEIPLFGCEPLFAHTLFGRSEDGYWREVLFSKLLQPSELPDLNPKRILKQWYGLWEEVDYGNEHVSELARRDLER